MEIIIIIYFFLNVVTRHPSSRFIGGCILRIETKELIIGQISYQRCSYFMLIYAWLPPLKWRKVIILCVLVNLFLSCTWETKVRQIQFNLICYLRNKDEVELIKFKVYLTLLCIGSVKPQLVLRHIRPCLRHVIITIKGTVCLAYAGTFFPSRKWLMWFPYYLVCINL